MVVGNPLIDLFGKSPVRPIQEHMQKVQSGTLILLKFVRAAQKGDWKEAESLQKEIVALQKVRDVIDVSGDGRWC